MSGQKNIQKRQTGVQAGGRRLAAVLLLATLAVFAQTPPVVAGPAGESIAAGDVNITRRGDATKIRASDGAIIDWHQGFDIAPHESVRFLQPGAWAQVLNRDHSNDATQIGGRLSANGTVVIANPYGVYIGGQARLNVGHLIGAAGHISNEDFLAGSLRFSDLRGDVSNYGRIEADSVALLGRRVANHGQIVGAKESVLLVAGDEVWLGERDSPIRVGLGPMDLETPAVENTGLIRAKSGHVRLAAGDMLGLAIRNSGSIRARQIEITNTSGDIHISGTLDAANTGKNGQGGSVRVAGDRIALLGASIDASGKRGGGEIRIGAERGGDPIVTGTIELPPASAVVIDGETSLRADALRYGDGGEIIVWGEEMARVHGEISVQGGRSGGDGGFVETSGLQVLDLPRAPDLRAPGGKAGHWLIDPANIVIKESTSPDIEPVNETEYYTVFEPMSDQPDPAVVAAGAVVDALEVGGQVTVTTEVANSIGEAAGTITLESELVIENDPGRLTNTALLQLLAADTITIQAPIRNEDESLTLALVFVANDNFLMVDIPELRGIAYGQEEAGEQNSKENPNFQLGDLVIQENIETGATGGPMIFAGVNLVVEDGAALDSNGGDIVLVGFNPVTDAEQAEPPGAISIAGSIETRGGEASLRSNGTIDLSGGHLNTEGGPARFHTPTLNILAPVDTGGGSLSSLESTQITVSSNVQTHGGPLSFSTAGGDIDLQAALITEGGTVSLNSSVTEDSEGTSVGGSITLSGPGTLIDTQLAAGEEVTDDDVGGSVTLTADSDIAVDGGIQSGGNAIQIVGLGSFDSTGAIDAVRATPGTEGQFIAGALDLKVAQNASIGGNLSAQTLDVRAGSGNDGTLSFAGNPVLRSVQSELEENTTAIQGIQLQAGIGSGNLASVDNLLGGPRFEGGTATDNPVRFAVIQDADMTDDTLPSTDQFGAGHVADLEYQLNSVGTDSTGPQTSGFITLTDKQKFSGAQLQLGTGTGASFESGEKFDLKSLILGVETSFEIDSAFAEAILAEDIGIISGSDLAIADGVELSAGNGASGSMALASGASGAGNLTFGTNVTLEADEISLAAGLASSGNSQVALVTGTGATQFRRNTDSDLNDHSFSITQAAAIEDSMLPEATAFLDASGAAAGSIDGMDYSLLSQGGNVTIETASKVANTNLSLVGLKGVELASTITVRSLTAGSTRNFEVTEDLVDRIQFTDPAQSSLAFQAGSSGDGNLSFAHSQGGAGITIAAEKIELYAGGPSSSSTSRIVFDDNHLPTFVGSGGAQTSPGEFFFRQSETIESEDLPSAARFGDGIGPRELFAIQSDGKSIQLTTPDSVAGGAATRLVTSATTVSFSASDENLDMNTRPVEIQATGIELSASASVPEAGSTEPQETFVVDASGIDQLSGFLSGSFNPDSPPETLPGRFEIQQSGRIAGSQLPAHASWQGGAGPDDVSYTLNSTEDGIDLSMPGDAALVQGSQLVLQVDSTDHDIDLGSGFSLQSLNARVAGAYTVNTGTEVEAEDFIVLTAGCARSDVAGLCGGQGNLVLTENITLRAPTINLQAGKELDLSALELASTDFVDESSGWAVGSSGSVLYTSDGGVSWLIQDSPITTNLRDVKFVNTTEGWAVGDEGVILQTIDGGDDWSELASGTTKELSGVTFLNSDEGWAVGGSGTILTTADGGENWSPQQSGTSHALAAADFISSSQGWTVGNNGTILATSDGGLTWTKQQSGTSQDLVDVTFATTTTGWAVGNTGTILTTSDGGTTWSSQDGAVTSSLSSLSFVDQETGWIVGDADPGLATILDTTDAGATWGLQGSGTVNNLSGVDFVDGQSGWVVGEAGTILHTADAGNDWEPQGIGGIVKVAPDSSIRFELVHASDDSETSFSITQNGDAISANLPIASQFGGNGSQSLDEVGNYALLVLGGTARITEMEHLKAANLQIGAPAIAISGESLGEDELKNTLLQAQSVTLEATGATGQVLADVDTLLIWGQSGLSNPNSFSLVQNPTVEPSDMARNLPDLSQFAQAIDGMTYSITSKSGDVIVNFPYFSPRIVSSSLRLQAGENRSVIAQTPLSVNSLYVNVDPSVANTNLILSAAPETAGQITIPTVSSITDQYYASPVVLAEDAELQAGGSIVFTSTINAQAEGEQSLKTGAGAGIQFGADIGGIARLEWLEATQATGVSTQPVVAFGRADSTDPVAVRTVGDIRLLPRGLFRRCSPHRHDLQIHRCRRSERCRRIRPPLRYDRGRLRHGRARETLGARHSFDPSRRRRCNSADRRPLRTRTLCRSGRNPTAATQRRRGTPLLRHAGKRFGCRLRGQHHRV